MTTHTWLTVVALCCPLMILGGCQERVVRVPDRVWDAAMAYCEHRRTCSGYRFFEYYTSIEDCADIMTKYFPWDRYTEVCIEAHIATFECEAAEPCYPEPYSCDLPNQLRSYHCWRFDTAY
ncbi:MAG: hypothetical protein RBU30_24110, partial [Polyangia bacterium]|nr:hypothetical protein [Polyangia bacterium]